MATITLYPSSSTYIDTMDSTDHSGAMQLKTGFGFKVVSSNVSPETWQRSVLGHTREHGAILRYERPDALKYARITAASLTWTIDGLAYDGQGQLNHLVRKSTFIAPYTTDQELSNITATTYKTLGIDGEWKNIDGDSSYASAPYTRTTNITSLIGNLQTSGKLDIIIAAGQGCDANDIEKSYINPATCYVTITYEPGVQPPPTLLYPKDVTLVEQDTTLFTWQFNSETAAVQTEARLEYKQVDAENYTVWLLQQSSYSHSVDAHLAPGAYQWRMKVTNDADDESDYSEIAYFNIVGKPATPIINQPDNKTLTEIKWNTTAQQSFEIILKDQEGRTLVHETQATERASYKPNMFLSGQYQVIVRVMNDSMQWSEWGQLGFTISASGPAAGSIQQITQGEIPALKVEYTIPQGAEAVLMRRNGTDEKIISILSPELTEYVDATVSSGVIYEYFVRTYSDGYTDSAAVSASANFDGAIFQAGEEWINLKLSDEKFLPHSEEISAPYALNEFSGRSYYVIERGDNINLTLSRKFFVAEDQKRILDTLSIAESVFYRDTKGNAFKASILKTSYDAFMSDGYLATISFVRLNEEEVDVNV